MVVNLLFICPPQVINRMLFCWLSHASDRAKLQTLFQSRRMVAIGGRLDDWQSVRPIKIGFYRLDGDRQGGWPGKTKAKDYPKIHGK
jgi:hypothetical protein